MTFESPTILAPTCNNFGPRMIKSHYSKISRPSSGDNHEPRPRQLLSLFFLAQLIPKVMRTPYREVAAGGWQLDLRFLDILKNRNLNDILFGWQPALEATGLRISTSLVGSLAEENKWKRLPPGLLWSFCLSTWPWNNNSTSRTDCIASAARAALCSWLCTKHVTWSWNIPQRKKKQNKRSHTLQSLEYSPADDREEQTSCISRSRVSKGQVTHMWRPRIKSTTAANQRLSRYCRFLSDQS